VEGDQTRQLKARKAEVTSHCKMKTECFVDGAPKQLTEAVQAAAEQYLLKHIRRYHTLYLFLCMRRCSVQRHRGFLMEPPMLNHMPKPYWSVTKTYASWQVSQLLACFEDGIGT
jgi:hypothetical protein